MLEEGRKLTALRDAVRDPSALAEAVADAVVDGRQERFRHLTRTNRRYADVAPDAAGAEIELRPEAERSLLGAWQQQPDARRELGGLLTLDVDAEEVEEVLGDELGEQLTRGRR